MNAAITVTDEYLAVDDALIDLNAKLGHDFHDHPRAAAMRAAVLTALMHLRYGRIERAAGIANAIRADLAAA
jgi:hypothetical protein